MHACNTRPPLFDPPLTENSFARLLDLLCRISFHFDFDQFTLIFSETVQKHEDMNIQSDDQISTSGPKLAF